MEYTERTSSKEIENATRRGSKRTFVEIPTTKLILSDWKDLMLEAFFVVFGSSSPFLPAWEPLADSTTNAKHSQIVLPYFVGRT